MESITELVARVDVLIQQNRELVEQNREMVARLERIEQKQSLSMVKEGYTPAEVGERLKRTSWVVAQWCNLGAAKAKKVRGRGPDGEWRISHEELLRLQADGPMPEGTFQNRPIRRAS
jgi:hypothetical protein